jgi:hypothetical protein
MDAENEVGACKIPVIFGVMVELRVFQSCLVLELTLLTVLLVFVL